MSKSVASYNDQFKVQKNRALAAQLQEAQEYMRRVHGVEGWNPFLIIAELAHKSDDDEFKLRALRTLLPYAIPTIKTVDPNMGGGLTIIVNKKPKPPEGKELSAYEAPKGHQAEGFDEPEEATYEELPEDGTDDTE